MLLPFVFNAEMIDTEHEENARLEREDILLNLLKFGIPYFQNDEEMEKFVKRLKQHMPEVEKKRWIEVLKSLGTYVVGCPSLSPTDLLLKLRKSEPTLVVLPSKKSSDLMSEFDLQYPRAFAPKTKTEYVAASHISKSTSLVDRSEWADLAITPEDNLKKIVDERISPLLKGCRRISIVDRWAFNTFREQNDTSGLFWFLNQLNSSVETTCKISLFSERPEDFSTTNFDISIRQIQNQLKKINGEFNIYLSPDYLYKKKGHDRYLRINDRRLIDIGKGVNAFSRGEIEQRSSFNYSVLKNSDEIEKYRKFEEDLKRPNYPKPLKITLGEGF